MARHQFYPNWCRTLHTRGEFSFHTLKELYLVDLSLLSFQRFRHFAIAQLAVATRPRLDHSPAETTILPIHIDSEVSSCAQSRHATVAPSVWQSREQMNESCVTLQEHFRDSSRATKVSVDLERRVCVPQIVKRAVLQQVAIEQIGMIAVVQTRPLVELPAHRPARSSIAAVLKHHTCGTREVGRCDW